MNLYVCVGEGRLNIPTIRLVKPEITYTKLLEVIINQENEDLSLFTYLYVAANQNDFFLTVQ